jgi:hypothetical protein
MLAHVKRYPLLVSVLMALSLRLLTVTSGDVPPRTDATEAEETKPILKFFFQTQN